jgi:hypothetical protein
LNTLSPADLARVTAYVDDALPPEDKARFEVELETNAALREELELQATLDASLGRLFEYSERGTGLPPGVPLASPRPQPRGSRSPFLRITAIAAALLLAAGAGWYFMRPDPNLIPPQQVWANMEKASFVPSWRCENEKVFREYLNAKLGESFAIDESESLRVVGWGYAADYKFYPISKQTLTLINKVGDQHAVVLIDKAEHDRELTVPPESGLHLFKKRVGNLVLYEMSPLPEPHVLPKVRV